MRYIIKLINVLNKRTVFLLVAIISISVLFITMAISAYEEYKNTIIVQQQKFLLTISKNAAISLERYVNDFIKDLSFLDSVVIEENNIFILEDYFESNKDSIYFMALIDKEQQTIFQQNSFGNNITLRQCIDKINEDNSNNKSFSEVIVSKTFKSPDGKFTYLIHQPIFINNQHMYTLILAISVDQMYKEIIEPINTGVKGYTMVKDSNGIIIMHPMNEQIGLDVIEGRKELYPDLDYTDLENLIKRQLQGDEGYELYNSYWWADLQPKKVKKLTGFAPAYIGDDFWVVATTLDYMELDFPISKRAENFFFLSVLFLLILFLTVFILFKNQRDKKDIEVQINYLQELNVALEDLKKSQHQLNHYQKLKTIGTFTSGIAHEINNLLTPILGYSEIILKELNSEKQLYFDVKEIQKAAIRAKEVIDQLLIYSRQNKNNEEYKFFSLDTALKNTFRTVENFLPPDITLEKNIEKDLGYIYGNETQVFQMLINLYSNAIQSMDKGKLTVSAAITNSSTEKELVSYKSSKKEFIKIIVEDTGSGIEKENLEEIFSPFFTTKTVGKGTGLGLSVVEGIVHSHKGEIFVKSHVGIGSTFIIYLPCSNDVEQIYIDEDKEKNSKLTKLNVLVVEDNKEIIKMIRRGLPSDYFNIEYKIDATTVLRTFTKAKYDLIITDFGIPDINGVQISRIIKKRNPNVKIILITEQFKKELERYKQENVIDEYLLKPFSLQELIKKIEILFGGLK